jgi:hypothetical protein
MSEWSISCHLSTVTFVCFFLYTYACIHVYVCTLKR